MPGRTIGSRIMQSSHAADYSRINKPSKRPPLIARRAIYRIVPANRPTKTFIDGSPDTFDTPY